jgi:hypothetical protein
MLTLSSLKDRPFPSTIAGRSGVAAVFFGLKIYPENVLAGINDPAVRDLLSGSFIVLADDADARNCGHNIKMALRRTKLHVI